MNEEAFGGEATTTCTAEPSEVKKAGDAEKDIVLTPCPGGKVKIEGELEVAGSKYEDETTKALKGVVEALATFTTREAGQDAALARIERKLDLLFEDVAKLSKTAASAERKIDEVETRTRATKGKPGPKPKAAATKPGASAKTKGKPGPKPKAKKG